MESVIKIWENYSKTKDRNIKEQLILKYSPLVKIVAGRLSVHLGQHVEYDDLVGYGVFGLIDAIDKFDYTKGVKFETYASLRIRGSIIDSIRTMDWVPRTVRQKNKEYEAIFVELEHELGRVPEENDLAEKLGVSVEEVREMEKNSSVASLISLDYYLEQNYETEMKSNSSYGSSPEKVYEGEELKKLLADSIDKLNENEKKVVTLYYYEELTLKEISAILGVSESRISQIHTKSVMKLKTKLGKYKSILFE